MAYPSAIFSDLDGTLLPPGATTVSPDDLVRIGRIVDAGIPFVAASGRQYASLQKLFEPVKDRISYVCENGCIAFHQGKVVSRGTMDQELARDLIRTILSLPDMELMVSGVDTVYILEGRDEFRHHLENVVGNVVTEASDIYHLPEPYFKISFYTRGLPFDKDLLLSRFGKDCRIVTGGNDWIDIMPQGISKATAIKDLLPILGAKRETAIAFADEENDTEMMEYVGIPIAMENAIGPIKKLARYTVKSVGETLDRILAGEEYK